MAPLAIAGDNICARPVVETPTLPKGFQKFRILTLHGGYPREALRRAVREMGVQIIANAKDTCLVAGCADGTEREEQ